MRKLSISAAAVAMVAPATFYAQVVLYDNLGQAYDTGNGAWDGGFDVFGADYGLQVGQRVANPGNLTITRVVGKWLTFGGVHPTSALIQVFRLDGDKAGPLISETVDRSLTFTTFVDPIFDLVGKKIDTGHDLSLAAANNGGDVLVTMQPASPDWGYLTRKRDATKPNTFYRDYPRCWALCDWMELGQWGYGSGDANMRVEAVPEPATLLAVGAGLAALAARRRR